MIQTFQAPKRKARLFKVKATGETGTAVSEHGTTNAVRLATIGPELNVQVIDLCDENTGETRTFRAEYLEEIEA